MEHRWLGWGWQRPRPPPAPERGAPAPMDPGPDAEVGGPAAPGGRSLAVADPARSRPHGPRRNLRSGRRRVATACRLPPAARRPPAVAPAVALCSASPSPCGAARSGPAPTPQSPRCPPGPPSSAHVTRRRPPSVKLYPQQPDAQARGLGGGAWGGAGPARLRARPCLATPPVLSLGPRARARR